MEDRGKIGKKVNHGVDGTVYRITLEVSTLIVIEFQGVYPVIAYDLTRC